MGQHHQTQTITEYCCFPPPLRTAVNERCSREKIKHGVCRCFLDLWMDAGYLSRYWTLCIETSINRHSFSTANKIKKSDIQLKTHMYVNITELGLSKEEKT